MPKILLVSEHYARVMLAEISPLNPQYHPKESKSIKHNTLIFLFHSFYVVVVVSMTAKPDGPGMMLQPGH